METIFVGNIRTDAFGRIVIDTCESDGDHLRGSVTDPISNRPKCRRLVEEAFAGVIGQRGRLTVTLHFEPEGPGAVPTAEIPVTATTRKVLTPSQLEQAVLSAAEHIDGE